MAGLVCAARARELGLQPRVLEKGTRAGGSMLLSSCVIWRHLEFDDFRDECPGGDEALQRLIWERLDDALAWLVSLGAEPVWEDTENPRTTGKRFDPRALTRLLARDVELETPLPAEVDAPLVLATGGFPRRLAARARPAAAREPVERRRGARLRDAPAARPSPRAGRVLRPRAARAAGADPRGGLRAALAALRPLGARLHRRRARDHAARASRGHENDLAQRIGPRAWYVLDDEGLEQPTLEAARAAGGTVVDPAELPFETPPARHRRPRRRRGHAHARRPARRHARARREALDGLYAAGVDAGGVALGGYASGLAQALVLGLAAAEDIAAGS